VVLLLAAALAAGVSDFRGVRLQADQVRSLATDSPLVTAVKKGDEAAVRSLLAKEAPREEAPHKGVPYERDRSAVNAPGPDGMTPLHWAARTDQPGILRLLLAAGAQPTAADRYGITPLALAAMNGSAPVIAALLNAGADAKGRVGDGETVLMAAARTGRTDAARLLLDRGADPNAREPWQGETAAMWAAGENHGDMVRLLAARKADLSVRSTVLEFPKAKVDLATMVTTALPRGGLTALMFAARQGASEGVRALAESGAPLDTTDPDGTTALVIAIINAHFDTAAVLIEKGANLDLADTAGMGPLYAAIDMEHQEPMINRPLAPRVDRLSARDIVSALLARGANANAALRAPLLMRQHSGGDPQLGSGATPLMRAAKVADLAIMRDLLTHGADPRLTLANGTTALHMIASRAGRNAPSEATAIEAMMLLLEHGADVHAATKAGQTALHAAVGRGDELVKFLVGRGARLDARDSSGRTPLDIALGVPAAGGGVRGRGGQPPAPGPVNKTTAALLEQLGGVRGAKP
jgi:ankyrin repeat protein